jgi:hypothetical protein
MLSRRAWNQRPKKQESGSKNFRSLVLGVALSGSLLLVGKYRASVEFLGEFRHRVESFRLGLAHHASLSIRLVIMTLSHMKINSLPEEHHKKQWTKRP